MICIISNEHDKSTDDVIQWLDYFEATWQRFNGEDLVSESKIKFSISPDSINSFFVIKKFRSVWFRRFYPFDYFEQLEVSNEIKEHCWAELSALHDYLYFVGDTKILGSNNSQTNKLFNLKLAQSAGLKIPKTLVTNCKTDLSSFKKEVSQIIIKPISETIDYALGRKEYTIYTREISDKEISDLTEFFFPVQAQEKLHKKFELRIFFLDNVFYPMAIFSQQNSQTRVDFRKYDYSEPNRNVPFILPKQLKTKLSSFVKKTGLNTGSIDMVCTVDNQFVFLEVNPSGQFGMVSYPCNYLLEKRIAEKLIEYSK